MIDGRAFGRKRHRGPQVENEGGVNFYSKPLIEQLRLIAPNLVGRYQKILEISEELARVGKLLNEAESDDPNDVITHVSLAAHLSLASAAAYPTMIRELTALIREVDKKSLKKNRPQEFIDYVRRRLEKQKSHLEDEVPGGWLKDKVEQFSQFLAFSRERALSQKQYETVIYFFFFRLIDELQNPDAESSLVPFSNTFFSAWMLFCMPEKPDSLKDWPVLLEWSAKLQPFFNLFFESWIQDIFDADSPNFDLALQLVSLIDMSQKNKRFYGGLLSLLVSEMIEPELLEVDIPTIVHFLEGQYRELAAEHPDSENNLANSQFQVYQTLAQALRTYGASKLGIEIQAGLCIFTARDLASALHIITTPDQTSQDPTSTLRDQLQYAAEIFGQKKFEIVLDNESENCQFFTSEKVYATITFNARDNTARCSLVILNEDGVESRPFTNLKTIFNFSCDLTTRDLDILVDDPENLTPDMSLKLLAIIDAGMQELVSAAQQQEQQRRENQSHHPVQPPIESKPTQGKLRQDPEIRPRRYKVNQPPIAIPEGGSRIVKNEQITTLPTVFEVAPDLLATQGKKGKKGPIAAEIQALTNFIAAVSENNFSPTIKNVTQLKFNSSDHPIWRIKYGDYRFLAVSVGGGRVVIFLAGHRSKAYDTDYSTAATNAFNEYCSQNGVQ